jgi:hypothetical protein
MAGMRFTIRDLLWLTAVVALSVGWSLDARRYDWGVKRAQYREDYYNLMSDLARTEVEKAQARQKQLDDALRRMQNVGTPAMSAVAPH